MSPPGSRYRITRREPCKSASSGLTLSAAAIAVLMGTILLVRTLGGAMGRDAGLWATIILSIPPGIRRARPGAGTGTVCRSCAGGARRRLTGLGRPVLFYEHPSFGYRLKPNQETWRFGGAHFKINNLGLRAESDWDASTGNKVLFLGDSVTYGGNHISNEDLFS